MCRSPSLTTLKRPPTHRRNRPARLLAREHLPARLGLARPFRTPRTTRARSCRSGGFSLFFSETLQERAAQSDWTDSKRIRFQN